MPPQNSASRREFLKGSAALAGASILAGCESAAPPRPVTATHSQFPTLHPEHNERTRGWLRFLWQKATTPDDWSYGGEEPHPWWDQYTTPPMLSYPRFDLSSSSYAMLLMADQTPAWREVYTRIMDELATRHTTFWAAIDWNTFIGPSPDRQNYPDFWLQQWPERVHGNYDAPGWTANGVEPWGLEPDPIGATGNLFFRGWLNLVLSIYKYVSGDDKWERPWLVAGYENEHFEWTQPRIVDYLRQQYTDQPEGPHCENTKIWPYCNSAAGLGIYLSDRLGGRPAHGVFENWVEYCRDNYMGINERNEIEWMTTYYDPLENFKVNAPSAAGAGAGVAFHLLPQSPELATQIYEAMVETLGWRDPRREIESNSYGLTIARALGDNTVVERLTAAAERGFEPRWFGEEMDRFGWWFNLGEDWPRGQRSAEMMVNEIGEGDWITAFQANHLDKYDAPTVEGVDFPNLGVSQAWNDRDSGVLFVSTYAADPSRRGEATSFRITNLPDASQAVVLQDGASLEVEAADANSIVVRSDIGNHRLQIYTGWFGQEVAVRPEAAPAAAAGVSVARRTAEENARTAEAVMLSGSATCPCCAGAA
ncbi:MAG: twin-arginine translocation signal domain-containing protein [Gammaproteobacteria bacterium]|nr:twin-arginine translocation signal domain-containing protein [Gammaproteobacteria bacterium]MYG95702.1 twin-arginine translocation signal domain-containing protein [Gammaproteobacteria bacterium]